MTAVQIADAVPLAVFLVAAAIALARPAARPTGVLLAVVAATWLVGTWVPALLWVHRAALIYVVFAFPALVPRPKTFIAVAGVLSVASALPVLVIDERASVAIGAAVVVGAVARFTATPRLQRGPVGVAIGAAALISTGLIAPIALRSAGSAPTMPLFVYCACLAMAAVVLAVYAVTATPDASTVTGLIGDLSDVIDTGTLRVRLAQALGDPSLRIRYVDGSGQLVDDGGLPPLHAGGSTRTPILVEGRPVAALLHDPAVRINRALAESIGSVIDLALRNVQLNDDVRSRAIAIADSRVRLMESEEAARRDVERALRDGPIRRFERASQLIRHRVDARELLEAVGRASADVRWFGRGLLPAAHESDLERDLTDLADDFPFRIHLDLEDSAMPMPHALRPTIWFACAEAVTNAAKHAEPHYVQISVRGVKSGAITITITDDGRGGAHVGSGLRGLAERVEALGGSLELASPVGVGTTVRVRLPRNTMREPA